MSADPQLSINKDTKLCMSLASRPANFGTRLHNFLCADICANLSALAIVLASLERSLVLAFKSLRVAAALQLDERLPTQGARAVQRANRRQITAVSSAGKQGA